MLNLFQYEISKIHHLLRSLCFWSNKYTYTCFPYIWLYGIRNLKPHIVRLYNALVEELRICIYSFLFSWASTKIRENKFETMFCHEPLCKPRLKKVIYSKTMICQFDFSIKQYSDGWSRNLFDFLLNRFKILYFS